ncbi:MAG: hypothetical protein KKA16_05440 [Alphaproteobacteria bacterium]|nr:hypothetical protein [Alphaproteobacteria bacterium]MBU2379870.1 hypothetical protein [Alphaproteobacteria bacterium]
MSPILVFTTALMFQTPGPVDLAPAFGNTLLSTYPDGRTARMWLQPGGRFEGRGRRGGLSSGVWRVRNGEVCFSQRRPIPLPGSFCTPIVRGGIGARWTAKAVTGETIQVELVAGR